MKLALSLAPTLRRYFMIITKLFSKAADTMYKKYMVNEAYRELVSPTGVERPR